ncbi:unnamed protein product [Owenia fusiformis]|uniref:G-protein coupled receptors family 1 profile domain-containing protein n=1 Tax=Owenia fusiformis TaxID=6347 RepID=A0A8S4PBU6_OWEFU|nr:unnamed protein product [Owenia fusiformis]
MQTMDNTEYYSDYEANDTRRGDIEQNIAIIYIALSVCIIIFGVIGNILSLIVLKKENEQSSRVFLLKTLAITDSLFLISYIGLIPEDGYVAELWDLEDSYDNVKWILMYFNHTASTLTTWVIVLVTIDRYIHIAKPLRASLIATVKRMRVVMGALTVTAAIYNLPLIVWHYYPTEENGPDYYFIIYECVLNFIFRFVGPVITVTVLNIKLIRSVRQSRIKTEHQTQEKKEERKQTLTMISILSVFIICSLINVGGRMLVLNDKLSELEFVFYNTANLFLLCNSACNVIFYFLFGKSFREKLKKIICCDKLN